MTKNPVNEYKFEKSKCIPLKISQGVRITAIRNIPERTPKIEPTRIIENCFLAFLKNLGKVNANKISDELIIKAEIIKIVKEMVFDLPERAIVIPKSLKKLLKNEYPGLKGSRRVPPA